MQILVDPVPIGDLVYDYLAQGTQGYFEPHSYDWLGHPLSTSDISGMSSPLLGYGSEPTSDFSMPSPLYVVQPPSSLHSLKIPLQELPGLPTIHPLTATFRNIQPGTSAASITFTQIEVPPSPPVLREYSGKVVLRLLLERLSWALGMSTAYNECGKASGMPRLQQED